MQGFLDQEGWVGDIARCVVGSPQGSEGGFWKPGPSLAVCLHPSEPFPLAVALSVSQRTLSQCLGLGPSP